MPPSQGTSCFQTRMLSTRRYFPMIISMYMRGTPKKRSMKKYTRIKLPEEENQELCSASLLLISSYLFPQILRA